MGGDLADMQLISRFNKGIRFLLCVIDIFGKYAWDVPLKDKKGLAIVNVFQKKLYDSKRKPNKMLVDKDSGFYNRSMNLWVDKNDIEMYLTHSKGKSAVAEIFIRNLKTKIYKYMISIPINVYIDKLNETANEYYHTYYKTIKIKPVDVKDNTYVGVNKEVNDKDPKFKVGDHVRMSKHKNIFAKGFTPNWSEEGGEKVIGTFYEKELQKTNQKAFTIEKVIKKKGDKLYVK